MLVCLVLFYEEVGSKFIERKCGTGMLITADKTVRVTGNVDPLCAVRRCDHALKDFHFDVGKDDSIGWISTMDRLPDEQFIQCDIGMCGRDTDHMQPQPRLSGNRAIRADHTIIQIGIARHSIGNTLAQLFRPTSIAWAVECRTDYYYVAAFTAFVDSRIYSRQVARTCCNVDIIL